MIHDWTSKKYVPSVIFNMCRFYFRLPGDDCTKNKKLPKKSADFGGWLRVLFRGLEFSHVLEVQHERYACWIYLMGCFLTSNYVSDYLFLMNLDKTNACFTLFLAGAFAGYWFLQRAHSGPAVSWATVQVFLFSFESSFKPFVASFWQQFHFI